MNTGTKTRNKRYDEAGKQSAVEYSLISGKFARPVVTELGFNVQNLPKRKENFRALQAKNHRLQKVLPRLASPLPGEGGQ